MAREAEAGMVVAGRRVLAAAAEIHLDDAVKRADLDVKRRVRRCARKTEAVGSGEAALQAEGQGDQQPKQACAGTEHHLCQ